MFLAWDTNQMAQVDNLSMCPGVFVLPQWFDLQPSFHKLTSITRPPVQGIFAMIAIIPLNAPISITKLSTLQDASILHICPQSVVFSNIVSLEPFFKAGVNLNPLEQI